MEINKHNFVLQAVYIQAWEYPTFPAGQVLLPALPTLPVGSLLRLLTVGGRLMESHPFPLNTTWAMSLPLRNGTNGPEAPTAVNGKETPRKTPEIILVRFNTI